MTLVYLILFLLSLLLPIVGFVKHKYKTEVWLFIIYVAICIVNLGYMLISLSKSLEFALFANKIVYFGQIFVVMSMLFLISRICDYKYRKWLRIIVISIGILMFLLVCTTGHLDWYYKNVELVTINGASSLVKEYGFLHPLYLVYVISCFLGMIFIIFYSIKRNKLESPKLVSLLAIIVFGNIGMWIIEKFIPLDFELLSVSYLFSEFVFFFIFYILEDYVHINNIEKTTRMLDAKISVDIINMPLEEKVNKILKGRDILSTRELEILELILQNKKRKEIAELMHLSENTVKTYTRSLYNKLEVNNRDELFSILID